MTYRELLELYKEGKLAEEQAAKVKKDIERQEAIGDYLLEESEVGGGAFDFDGEEMELAADDTSAEFAKMVRKSIRKAFIKLGIIVFVIIMIIVLFIQYALPDIVESKYYNPGVLVGEDKTDVNCTQMGMDMGVYTELNYPLDYRHQVCVDDRGYGDYDIRIIKGYGLGDQEIRDIIARIEKGKLTMYNENFLYPYGNSFKWNDYSYSDDYEEVTADTTKHIKTLLEKADLAEMKRMNREVAEQLDESDRYICYVTPEYQLKYEEFMKFVDKNPWAAQGWCAVRTGDGQLLPAQGFQYDPFFADDSYWDKEKYPNLIVPSSTEKWNKK